ncbi:hypothetical protein E8E12_008721 [Didymella heteroderae]|uniref:Heterokaryon incompatibility domain-containing protein n=1 Tax=Didymella heteroderae TaxID=1769908 RepID=A0A9P4WPH2_9PLEO|nr:hypothetical protein E8E12_008721 [Didymella heteroderae]
MHEANNAAHSRVPSIASVRPLALRKASDGEHTQAPNLTMHDLPDPVYQHESLDHRRSIRLLELLPDAFGQPLRCIINQYPHGHGVSYEALSYTWDDPDFPECISVGDEPSAPFLCITRNLYNALQHLRDPNRPRLLWIDALCIDQSNLEEKGHQVAHMGRIYSAAEDVIVWLGVSRSRGIPHVLEKLVNLGEQLRNPDLGYTAKITGLYVRLQAAKFFDFTWFFRVWTVQEFVLGKRVWFQIGSYRCDEGTMRAALKNLQDAIDKVFTFEHDILGPTAKDVTTIRSINNLFQIRTYHQCAQTASPQPNSTPLTLVLCASSLARHRLCADKRDRIYGMLAIASGNKVYPNYHESAETLFLEVATESLQQGDFSMLHEHSMQDYENATSFLLSAFEPSDGEHLPVWRTVSRHAFQASTKLPVQVLVQNATQITIAGLTIDTILHDVHLARAAPDPRVHMQGNAAGKAALVREYSMSWYQAQYETRCQPYEDERVFDVMVRTIVADSHQVQDVDGAMKEFDDWPIDEQKKLWQRSLFKTERGYLGLGSHDLRPGDLVVLFSGAKTPFILRKEPDSDSQGPIRYRLVSDCYLHGWMNGDYFGHKVIDEDGHVIRGPPLTLPRKQTEKVLKQQQFIIC